MVVPLVFREEKSQTFYCTYCGIWIQIETISRCQSEVQSDMAKEPLMKVVMKC